MGGTPFGLFCLRGSFLGGVRLAFGGAKGTETERRELEDTQGRSDAEISL